MNFALIITWTPDKTTDSIYVKEYFFNTKEELLAKNSQLTELYHLLIDDGLLTIQPAVLYTIEEIEQLF